MVRPDGNEIVQNLKRKFGGSIRDVREDKNKIRKAVTLAYWITIDPVIFHDVVKEICDTNYPFLAVISGRDAGDSIILIYHLYVKTWTAGDLEQGLNIVVPLPYSGKSKPKIPTITDLIPGALISELEKQEMLGVDIEGVPEEHAFLPMKHPDGFHPWRRDPKTGQVGQCPVGNVVASMNKTKGVKKDA